MLQSHSDFRFLDEMSMCMSMPTKPTTPVPTPSPTPKPTPCPLTDGTTFTFDSYIYESDLIYDDTYVHHQFSITVKCDCHGKAVNGGTVGPVSKVNLLESDPVDGPFINVINQKDLQVDWEGSALEGDAPGWSIAATGAGLCFTPAVKAGVCILVAGLAAEVFDDEVLWGYRRSATFKCMESGDSWTVEMTENGDPLQETFETNESEFYTDFTSSSSAAAGIVSHEQQERGSPSSGDTAALPFASIILMLVGVVAQMYQE